MKTNRHQFCLVTAIALALPTSAHAKPHYAREAQKTNTTELDTF